MSSDPSGREFYPVRLLTIGRDIAVEIDEELLRAEKWGQKFASLHECCAVIFEEYEEVWEICRQKRQDRDPEELRKELIQLAAMAIKGLKSMENLHGADGAERA